jgi:hypothetical protein
LGWGRNIRKNRSLLITSLVHYPTIRIPALDKRPGNLLAIKLCDSSDIMHFSIQSNMPLLFPLIQRNAQSRVKSVTGFSSAWSSLLSQLRKHSPNHNQYQNHIRYILRIIIPENCMNQQPKPKQCHQTRFRCFCLECLQFRCWGVFEL